MSTPISFIYKIAKKIPVNVEIKPTKNKGVKAETQHIIDNGGKGLEHKEIKIEPGKLEAKKVKHTRESGEGYHEEQSEVSSSFSASE